MVILELENMTKSFDKQIFENISGKLTSQRLYILFGPNGSGKTTFFNCLAGIVDLDFGRVIYNGKDTSNHESKRNISYLLTGAELFPYLQPDEFLSFHFSIFEEKIDDKEITELFERLDLEISKDIIMDNLSTGMRQKIMLSSVLLRNTAIYILDEPTSGLDDQSKKVVVELLKEKHEQNKLLIISSHDTALLGYLEEVFDASEIKVLHWKLGMRGEIFG